ncbi:MAG: glutaredoxin 3 [Sphingomonadales bacterium]
MVKVEIYSSALCGYCYRAKALLRKKGIKYDEVDITFSAKKRTEMERRAKRYTVPQIFIGGKSIGGSDELHDLEYAGKLDDLLAG